jgi:hypothetical protein
MTYSEDQFTEDRLQQECYLWFHNSFPNLRGLLCYNFNNSANKIQANKNRGMGLQKGRSDLVFYYKGNAFMIEMKTSTGTQQPEQKKWQEIVVSSGFTYQIARSKKEFQEIINKIIG